MIMKKLFTITLGILLTATAYAQTFNKAIGGATDVAISNSGNIFVVGTSKQIFKYDFNENKFKLHSVADRKVKAIAANEDWNYLLTTDGRMYRSYARDSRRIDPLGYVPLKDIYVGKNNDLWGINSKGMVQRYYSGWRPFSIAGSDNKKVCVNNSGRVFSIKNNNTIWEYYNGRARKLPGGGTDITYDHAQNKLYVLGTSKRIFVWSPVRNNWELVKNTRNDFRSIAAYNGKIWGTTTRNEIFSTANIRTNNTTSNSGSYKLKITLVSLEATKVWDADGKDDYLLHFEPTLKLNGREQFLKYKKYGRIGNLIDKYGPRNALYIRRTKEQRDHANVQIHARKNVKERIGNSGIFEIPKNYRITDSGTDFNVKVVIDEVSDKTIRVRNKNAKFNLKEILNYLLNKTRKTNYKCDIKGWCEMGAGYDLVKLERENQKAVAVNYVSGYKTKGQISLVGYAETSLNVKFVFELVD
jgi:putative transposon-encoded protein